MAGNRATSGEKASEPVRERAAVFQAFVRPRLDDRRSTNAVQVEREAQVLAQVIANAEALRVHGVGAIGCDDRGADTVFVSDPGNFRVAAFHLGERASNVHFEDQIADGKLSVWERTSIAWMKISRGDIADRFDKIRAIYLSVTKETRNQIEREHRILDAYRDFRGALKQAEVLALEVLKKAEAALAVAKERLTKAAGEVANFSGTEPAERAKLELVRDEVLRQTQDEDKRYQITKDVSDNLTIGYNTSEVIMARLMQTTSAKERVYAQAVAFFSTNDTVLTALKASFTGMFGLNEATQTVNAMKEGVSRSIEVLSEIGDKVQEAAVRAGYGPTIRADAVKKLVDSVVNFQEKSGVIIEEMRKLATQNSAEIREAVEDGKKRIARLVAQGKALTV